MVEPVYDFGLCLKELRINKGLTQKQVGEIVGVKERVISSYERNVGSPSVKTIKRLAFLFGVSVDYLLGIEKRRAFYVDDVPENIQTMLLHVVEVIKKEYKDAQDKK